MRAPSRGVAFAAVTGLAFALALAYGASYATNNQLTYLLDPMRRAHPGLWARDWLVSSTTSYHPVFGWLAAPLYAIDPRGVVAFGVAQLVVMAATLVALERLLARLAEPRVRLAMFALLAGVLALGGGRALAGTYLFAGYLQPSSLASLGWLIALIAWLDGRRLIAGLWLAVAGACHVNFLILGIGLFGAVELAARPRDLRRLAMLIVPSLVVLLPFVPALLGSTGAHDDRAALRVLVEFHAPGHFAPGRIARWLPPLIGWLALAWGALPVVRAAAGDAADRLWRFAAVGTAMCAIITALVAIPPLLGLTRLFVWRLAPFAQLASQLLVIAGALSPSVPIGRARLAAIAIGALIVIVESTTLGGGHLALTAGLGLIAAAAFARHALQRPGLAAALALAAAVLALAVQHAELRDPPLFGPECDGANCALRDWVRRDTAVDAVFLVPPAMNWFRLLAERAIVADTKSPPLYPDELVAWKDRLCAIVGAELATHEAVEARWATLDAGQILAAARRFAVDYVVLDADTAVRLDAPIAHQDAGHVVYRVR